MKKSDIVEYTEQSSAELNNLKRKFFILLDFQSEIQLNNVVKWCHWIFINCKLKFDTLTMGVLMSKL